MNVHTRMNRMSAYRTAIAYNQLSACSTVNANTCTRLSHATTMLLYILNYFSITPLL